MHVRVMYVEISIRSAASQSLLRVCPCLWPAPVSGLPQSRTDGRLRGGLSPPGTDGRLRRAAAAGAGVLHLPLPLRGLALRDANIAGERAGGGAREGAGATAWDPGIILRSEVSSKLNAILLRVSGERDRGGARDEDQGPRRRLRALLRREAQVHPALRGSGRFRPLHHYNPSPSQSMDFFLRFPGSAHMWFQNKIREGLMLSCACQPRYQHHVPGEGLGALSVPDPVRKSSGDLRLQDIGSSKLQTLTLDVCERACVRACVRGCLSVSVSASVSVPVYLGGEGAAAQIYSGEETA